MSLRLGSSHRSRFTLKILATLSLFAVGMTFAAPNVSAATSLNWSLDSPGGDCVQILDRDVRIDTAAMPALEDPDEPDGPVILLFPTGSYTNGVGRSVVDIDLSEPFIEAGGGFYLMGFRFVENCDTWDVDAFEPCFGVRSTYSTPIVPWILSFEPGEYLFFFLDLEPGPATISIDVGLEESDCEFDDPANGSGEIDELLEAIDELDLDLDKFFDVVRRPRVRIDLDYYRRRAAEQAANALPDTL